jgi:hypothetical protein
MLSWNFLAKMDDWLTDKGVTRLCRIAGLPDPVFWCARQEQQARSSGGHTHLLIWSSGAGLTSEEWNSVITTQSPDPEVFPLLAYQASRMTHVHKPCCQRVGKDGKPFCRFFYPWDEDGCITPFQDEKG